MRNALNGLRPLSRIMQSTGIRQLSFTFAGPRSLDDILKKDLVKEKTGSEVAEIWFDYHEEKVRRIVDTKDSWTGV